MCKPISPYISKVERSQLLCYGLPTITTIFFLNSPNTVIDGVFATSKLLPNII